MVRIISKGERRDITLLFVDIRGFTALSEGLSAEDVQAVIHVYPAADIPLVAVRSGAQLIVVNAEPTPFDDLAAVVIRGKSGEILPEIAGLIGA
jgi:NAD-dependent SIR2 family protein deacetylase